MGRFMLLARFQSFPVITYTASAFRGLRRTVGKDKLPGRLIEFYNIGFTACFLHFKERLKFLFFLFLPVHEGTKAFLYLRPFYSLMSMHVLFEPFLKHLQQIFCCYFSLFFCRFCSHNIFLFMVIIETEAKASPVHQINRREAIISEYQLYV